MNVVVIGPGATGCLFAARFMEAGHKVHLVDYREDRIQRLQNAGIELEGQEQTLHVYPKVTLHIPGGQDLILVTTKAHATPQLQFPPDTPILTLQNGLGNAEQISRMVGSGRVLAGTTLEAATLVDEGVAKHHAAGLTTFGSWTTCPDAQAQMLFQSAGFEVALTNTPGQVIWKKVVVSSGINPLTALLQVPNGRLLEIEGIRLLLRDLVLEAARVAATEGYSFDQSLVEHTETVCRNTASNYSSMLQDIQQGRKTEIDAISGEIIRRGKEAALPTPRTQVVYQLLRGLENL